MDSALKVATPLTAGVLPPPERVPPPGFVPIAKVTPFVALVTRLLNWSRISTCTAGVIVAPAVVLAGGCTIKFTLFAPARFTLTGAVGATATPPTAADTGLVPATAALCPPAAPTLASLAAAGWRP